MDTSSSNERRFRVVVTRDGGRAAALATRLAAHGGDVVTLPVTRVTPPDPAEWAELVALVGGGSHDTVVVASANAAGALVRAVSESGRAPATVLAVGAATAEVLAAAGIVSETAPRADAVGVAELAIARGARAVLWPRADGGREEGIDRLRASGVRVDAPVAYRTVPAPPDDPDVAAGLAALAGADVVCVYAPSQVTALEALLAPRGYGALAGVAVVAIGETTAAALRARGVAVAAVPASPDPESMARAITGVLHRSP